MNFGTFRITLFLFLFVLALPSAWASPFTFNVDGVITNSANQALEAAAVNFQVDIQSPSTSCILYREVITVNMTGSGGYFSIPIGKQANAVAGGFTLDKVFSNQGGVIPGDACSYTPGSTQDSRKIIVSFNDGATSQTFVAQEIQSVPFALEAAQAVKIGSYSKNELLKVDPAVDQTGHANTALNQAQYDEFWALILGSSSTYIKSTTSLSGDVSGSYSANTVTKIQGTSVSATAPTTGQTLVYTAGAWTPTTPSGVMSISANLPLSVSGSSSASLSISQANGASDGYLSMTDWNNFNNKQTSSLSSAKLWVGNSSGIASEVSLGGDVTMDNAGAVTLNTSGVTAGTYNKVTVDSKGRVTAGSPLAAADVTNALGYNPLNKNGDVMTGNLGLYSVATDPGGLSVGDKGKMWYRSDLDVIKYWNGSTAVTLGAAGVGIADLNGLATGSQSFAVGTSGNDISITSAVSTHTLDIPTASATKRGALSAADWSTFNSKMGSGLNSGLIWVGNGSNVATPVAVSGDATIDNAGALAIGAAKITAPMLSSGGSIIATTGVVTADATGNLGRFACSTTGHVATWSATGWSCSFPSPLLPPLASSKIWVGNASGGPTEVLMSGDVSIDNAGVTALANSGVSAGAYSKVTVDIKGRVTAGAALAAADITTALTYTPVNKAGDTMSGALAMGAFDITNTGNITMAANKYFGLSANSTNGTVAGQMWYDTGIIKYYDGSSVKSLGVAGAGITSFNGLSTPAQSFVVGTAGTNIGITSSGSAHTLDIPTASASNRGALSSTDWATFNSKQTNSLASAKIWVGNSSGGAAPVSMSGDATMDNAGVTTLSNSGVSAGTYNKVTVDGKGRVIAGAVLTANDLPVLNSAKVWVGNGSSVATPVSVTGDITMDNAGVTTLSNSGVSAGAYSKVTVDIKGRVTAGASLASADITTALGYTPVNKAGDAMTGALAMGAFDITNTGNITMAANKYFSLSANSTNGTVAGQMWYDAGVIKYYDGSVVKSLGVAGAGITNLNGLTSTTQSFVVGTAGTNIGITSSGSAHTLDIPTASASNRGALSSADWTTFNSKQTNSLASAKIWVGNASGGAAPVSMSGDATMDNAGALAIGAAKIMGPMLSSGGTIIATTGVVTADATGNLGRFTCSTTGHVATWSVTGWSCAAPAAVLPSLASTNLWVGNASGGPAAVAMSGDATMSNTGAVTLASSGVSAGTYSKVTVDGKGRVTAGAALAAADVTTALGFNPLNKAGDTMSGALAMGGNDITGTGNISMAANKYFGLSSNSTNGTVAGQMWYDAGVIKYYDGSVVKSLGVAGAGITSLNGIATATQSFVVGTAGIDVGITSAGSAHTFNIPTASASNRGALSSTDWATFNSKQTNSLASAKIWVGNSSGGAAPVSMSGDATMDNAGVLAIGAAKITGPMLSSGGTIIATTGVVTADATGNLGRFACSTTGHVATWSASGWSCSFPSPLLPTLSSAKLWVGNASGIASEISLSGDVTMSNTGVVTLVNSGVTAGTYSKVTVDGKGRVTAGAALAAADVTTALGFTPLNKNGDAMTGALAMGGNDITGTGNISMAANKYFGLSSNSTNGTVAGQMWYDTGTIKYYDGSSVKSLGVAGAGITSLNGLSTPAQSFVVGTAGTNIGITSSGSTHTLDIPTASATSRGALSAADWMTFNSKMGSGLTSGQIWVGNSSGLASPVVMSGDATMSNTGAVTLASSGVTAGTYNKVTVDGKGRVVSGSALGAGDVTTALGYAPFAPGGNSFGVATALGTNDNYNLSFKTNNAARMTIANNGNVGIGTTTPSAPLEVTGRMVLNGPGTGSVMISGGNNSSTGTEATFIGLNAGYSNTTGFNSTFIGSYAGYANTTGYDNTFVGTNAGSSVTIGSSNVIIGSNDGSSIATLSNNILIADGAGTERIRVNNLGNVGIGTTTPTDPLTISASPTLTSGTLYGTTSTLIGSPSAASGANYRGIGGTAKTNGSNNFSGDLVGVYGEANHLGTGTASNLYGGFFNVATTVGHPATKSVAVKGTVSTTTVASTTLIGGEFAVNKAGIGTTTYGISTISNNASGTVTDNYGIYSEAIDSGGGTTNAFGGKFKVTTGSTVTNGYGVYIDTVAASTNKYGLYQSDVTNKNYFAGNVGIGTTTPTYALQLGTDSAAKPGTSTWTIASDERLKDIRGPFTRGLASIEEIHPIYFNYKQNNPLDLPSDKEYVGIRAQDALRAVPEAVSQDEKGFYHVTNDSIIWTLFNAVKELYHKWMEDSQNIHQKLTSVDSNTIRLEAENEKLKQENTEIKARLDRLEKIIESK